MANTKDKKKANPLLEEDEEMDTKKSKTSKPAAKKAAKKEVEEDDVEDETDEEVVEDEVEEEEEEEEQDEKPVKASKTASKPVKVDIAASLSKDILDTKTKLEKQPKVRFFIPLGINEVAGSPSAVESVTINGYRMVYPKGRFIDVPQAVANILEEHYNMTPENTEAGRQFRLDRSRTHDGFSTSDALDA